MLVKMVDTAYKSPNNIWTLLYIHRHSNSAADMIAGINKHNCRSADADGDAIVRAYFYGHAVLCESPQPRVASE